MGYAMNSSQTGYPVRPITVVEYHRMIELGLLIEDDPVELLEEWIVTKSPGSPRHEVTIEILDELLRACPIS